MAGVYTLVARSLPITEKGGVNRGHLGLFIGTLSGMAWEAVRQLGL